MQRLRDVRGNVTGPGDRGREVRPRDPIGRRGEGLAMTKILMKGNEAIGAAAIAAGCRYFFGYPVSYTHLDVYKRQRCSPAQRTGP